MIKWVVGEAPEGGTIVARFPADNGVHALEKISQPAEIRRKTDSQEVELEVGADVQKFRFGRPQKNNSQSSDRRVAESESWEISDKDGKTRFVGGRSDGVPQNSWFVARQVTNAKGEEEYHLTKVDEWINFSAKTTAMESALDLDRSEQLMKESKVKAKAEFSEYLKQKRKKAIESGLIEAVKDMDDTLDALTKKTRRKLVLKRIRGNEDGDDMELAESSVAFVGKSREIEGEWEGEEAFSDDDEQLFEDEANANLDLGIDVEEDDVEKDHDVRDEDDLDAEAKDFFKNTFGSEIEKLIHQEQEKEHVADDELDDELSKYAGEAEEEEEEQAAGVQPSSSVAGTIQIAASIRKTASREEQIRARVKGMFWRNDNKLKLREILGQFPGLSKTSEEYQYLTKALRDIAEVKGDILHLKQQFRK